MWVNCNMRQCETSQDQHGQWCHYVTVNDVTNITDKKNCKNKISAHHFSKSTSVTISQILQNNTPQNNLLQSLTNGLCKMLSWKQMRTLQNTFSFSVHANSCIVSYHRVYKRRLNNERKTSVRLDNTWWTVWGMVSSTWSSDVRLLTTIGSPSQEKRLTVNTSVCSCTKHSTHVNLTS